ncbi:MAG TPA: neutral/alkaline non-lysosomal ceramidase N-terminal domain-containing protein, partial [Solirubrobacteraceae bacterium]
MARRLLTAFTVVLVAAIAAPAGAGAQTAPPPYSAGAAVRAINPTAAEIAGGRVFLGGYGLGGDTLPGESARKATGILGEGAKVRAFAVADRHGGAFAIADMELQGWFVATKDGPYGLVDMRRAVERRTGGELKAEEVVVQSDHSHSGPDGIGVWGGIPLAYRKRIFDQTVAAIVDAWDHRAPARLFYGAVKGNGLAGQPDLLNNQFAGDPANASLDDELRVLQARDAAGKPLITLLNFSAHATVLGSDNTKVSGDWIQRANPMLEAAFPGSRAVTVVGTLGRTQPKRTGCVDPTKVGDAKFLCELDTYARRVTDRAKLAVAAAKQISGGVVGARSYLIQDPATNPVLLSAAAVGSPIGLPVYRSVTPPWLTGNVIGTVTASARIGDVLLSAGPGEMYPQIPLRVRELATTPYRGYMTAGLANDQLGYLIAPFPEAFPAPICATVFDGCEDDRPDAPSPIANDNYAFDVSHTLGERVACSLLRGAGELAAEGTTFRDADPDCAAYANDLAFGHGADTGRPSDPATTKPVVATTFTGAGASGPVKAGVGVVDANWKVGASAGQYASTKADYDPNGEIDPSLLQVKNLPSYGFQARMQARALVIQGADGKRAAMVKNDLYIPQDLLWRRTAQILEAKPALGIGHANLTMTVTHDHSSPYYSSLAPGAWTFQDVVDLRFYEYYAQQMAAAVEKAATHLKPVRIGAAVGRTDKVHRHSFGPAIADDGTPAGYPNSDADHDLTVMRLDDISDKAHPKPLGMVLNYSVHPEMLEGNDLISPDWVGAVQRMLDRETGAVTIVQQSSVGTAEPERSSYHSMHERLEFTHRDYAQMEYAARLISDKAKQVYRAVETGRTEVPSRYVPFASDMPVAMADRWYPGPLSHPYPGVSSCRTDEAFHGDPKLPVVGLPDCNNADGALHSLADVFGFGDQVPHLPGLPVDPGLSTDDLQRLGLPIPENLSAPSYVALQEDVDVHLQALRIGEILFTFCSCEQWADQARNIKSRTNRVRGDQHLGYDWGAQCTAVDGGKWSCPNPENPSGPRLVVGDHEYRRMRAQVRNDATGWDFVENAPSAESEPVDPDEIRGNYTHEELPPTLGYKLTVPVAMADDYNGYIATYREYQRGDHYRKALTAWGPHSSDYLATRLVELGGHLKQRQGDVLPTESERALADQLGSIKIPPDLQHNDARAKTLGETGGSVAQAYEATLPDDGGTARILGQPAATVERFGAAFLRWNGGSNYTDNPVVRVERRVDGRWEPYADQSGEIPTTLKFPAGEDVPAHETGSFEWEWTATFEAFVAPFDTGARGRATPTGEYRFVVDGRRRSGGAAKPYHLVSRTFAVQPWSGIVAEDLRRDDGTLSFRLGPRHRYDATADNQPTIPGVEIGPIDYPDSYASTVRFVRNQREARRDPAAPLDPAKLEWYCFTCSFRPWIDAGDARTAVVRITRADGRIERVKAVADGDRWRATATLAAGDSAVVAPGGVLDAWGNRNGAPSNVIAVPPGGGGGGDGGGGDGGGGDGGGGDGGGG